MKSPFVGVYLIKIGDATLQSPMRAVILQQSPIQAFVKIPFLPLSEIAAHEEKLFARMSPHVAIKQSGQSKLLP